eukprot:6462429-Amphidinium_carterae.1
MDSSVQRVLTERYCQLEASHFTDDSGITQESLALANTCILHDSMVATPQGIVYKGGRRHLPSGGYKVNLIESFFTTVVAIRSSLVVQREEAIAPLKSFGVLADDLLTELVDGFSESYANAVNDSARRFGLNVKDDILIGDKDSFDLLGYNIVRGRAQADSRKLLAQLLQPERAGQECFTSNKVSPRTAAHNWYALQASRAIGISNINRM